MLVIVNPYATTVSDRLKNLVVYALQGRYEVDAMDTEGRDHATILCREAAEEGYDVVVAFGGDGTVNEAANGLHRDALRSQATQPLLTITVPSANEAALAHLHAAGFEEQTRLPRMLLGEPVHWQPRHIWAIFSFAKG